MVKKAARAPIVPKIVTKDNECISNLSSQQGYLFLKDKELEEPSSVGKVKNVESKISEIESLSSSRKNKSKTFHDQSNSFEWDPSDPDQRVPSNNISMDVCDGAQISRINWEDGLELSTCIDAALALMELASDNFRFPKSRLYFNANPIPNTSGLIDQSSDTITCRNQSAGYKTKVLEMFHLSTADKEGNSEMLCKKKKTGNMRSLLPSSYEKDDGGEEDIMLNKGCQHVKACLKFGCDPLGMSMMSSFKSQKVKKKQKKKNKTAVPFVPEQVEYDHDHLYSRKTLDEPPISSFKKHGSQRGKTVPKTEPFRKLQVPQVSPNGHKGISFSIICFLSAIRAAMVMQDAEENTSTIGKHLGEDNCYMTRTEKMKLPFLTIQEVIECVRRNPIDPGILETREPLEDLVRGALNIFSSNLAPLGAKVWQPLTSYMKSTKSWVWIGPISFKSNQAIKEGLFVEAWGLPRKTLAKLVDSFANWLRSIQETHRQIRSLPSPPVTSLLRTAHLEQRLKSVRPRKCTATISPCSAELRAHFHKEEALRYSVPQRAFAYTAVDGRKSTVAPMRRSSGKPSSKVRDHFMLKADRPPHVTVLCLVRDAAARLPEKMGTRTDVCTLMRDSQYIVDFVSDEQLNQVVSRGLDRLHYENDPCVLYNGDTKLWVYLHGDRDENDFDDDCTSSHRRRY